MQGSTMPRGGTYSCNGSYKDWAGAECPLHGPLGHVHRHLCVGEEYVSCESAEAANPSSHGMHQSGKRRLWQMICSLT